MDLEVVVVVVVEEEEEVLDCLVEVEGGGAGCFRERLTQSAADDISLTMGTERFLFLFDRSSRSLSVVDICKTEFVFPAVDLWTCGMVGFWRECQKKCKIVNGAIHIHFH